ncbi:MAG: IS1182 family transposase [Lachnospiraceae bacterium]|nr:IS1182 family transposase [Lachnospiraceae bacterium]
MTKNHILQKDYTQYEHEYQLKLPLNLEVCIPNDDCVRLIRQFVEELDLTELYDTYERLPSGNHPTPDILLKLLLYAYHERTNIASREVEQNCKRDINYLYLLEGKKAPDHSTFARFRTDHFGRCARPLLAQMAEFLYSLGEISETELFIDGTKIEANANRYTFVWKKSVTKHQAKALQKMALLVGDIIGRYEMKPLRDKIVRKKHVKKLLKKLRKKAKEENLEFVSGRGHKKTQLQQDIEALQAGLEKLKEYETKLHICGKRNSYSKTDPDATFLHMKDDHMKNGQLKPGYNLQHAVNSGYIVMVGIFPNPGDTLTLKPFVEQMEESLKLWFERMIFDSGYESEENLKYLEERGIEAYIKPANYEQRNKKKFAEDISKKENMEYDAEEDCYICKNGKRIKNIGEKQRKTASGYIRTETQYHCDDCDGCPYREPCMPGKNWKKPLEERYKHLTVSKEFERLRAASQERIQSEEGKKLRMNRSIQAEGSFGDIKGDSGFTRFLCRGTDAVFAESALFAMAHNLGWLHSRIQNGKLGEHLYELKKDAEETA